MRKSGLPPIVDEHTEILILGTLPSDMAIETGQYYANPSNDFWRLAGAVLNQSFDKLSYEAKTELLKRNKIGLWDVFHNCIRPGSMDKAISDPQLNDFGKLKSIAPSLRVVCFNGKKAGKAEILVRQLGYATRVLLSSSGANRKKRMERLDDWRGIV